MVREFLEEAAVKMEHAVSHAQDEFATVRTGRANPQILHRVMVDYYGAPTALQQLASFSVPEPRLLIVQPFDKNSISDVEKAIQASGLGLNPANDGSVIRIAFPALTEDRRRELIRVVRSMAEEGRIAIRNVRRHTKHDIEAVDHISEDEVARAEKELDELTHKHIEHLDELLGHKEEELLEV